jgi:hypothetical protein
LDDDFFYPSDFEEELEHVVGVEVILKCAIGSTTEFASTSTFGKIYFTLSDYESECEGYDEGHEEDDRRLYEVDNDPLHFSTNNTGINVDEYSLPSFAHIPIETFPKYVHFTIASQKLMIECLEGQMFPTFDQICEADASFRPLSKSHSRSIDVNDVFHIIKRWKKLQENVKLVGVNDGIALAPSRHDQKGRRIPPIEHWCSIVEKSHVDATGKHLPLPSTLATIREDWTTDNRVGGIHTSYVENCFHSCDICKQAKLWDEVHKVPHQFLNATLDEICMKYVVLRRVFCSPYRIKSHVVTYYCCHRGGKKHCRHRKQSYVKPLESKDTRQDRKSKLYNCSFQVKTIEPIVDDNIEEGGNVREAIIFVHTKHTGHEPSSDKDKLFLPVHPVVLTMAKENLKKMISTSTVALASIRNEEKLKTRVGDLERVTYRFSIIPKEVEQLKYSMRLNGMFSSRFLSFIQVICFQKVFFCN